MASSGKCRLLANPALRALDGESLDRAPRTRYVRGGHLEQPNYAFVLNLDDPGVETTGPLTEGQARDLLLAWAIGSTSNSNTVTLVRDGQLLGNGVGQQDRVGGCALAITRAIDAGNSTHGCVAYSDSYFPFPDGPQVLIDAGVSAVFCTTGSVRDALVRQTFPDAGVTLVQLPDHTARGFFGHLKRAERPPSAPHRSGALAEDPPVAHGSTLGGWSRPSEPPERRIFRRSLRCGPRQASSPDIPMTSAASDD